MGWRAQVVAYVILASALGVISFELHTLSPVVLICVFGVGFVAALIIVVDARRKVFGAGKKQARNVDC